jgi:uncharacterized repeat protein (TIGR03943 family)
LQSPHENSSRRNDPGSLVRGALLLAWTALLVRLVITGEIVRYIHPRFSWFTLVAAAGLTLMALGQLRRARLAPADPGTGRWTLYAVVAAVVTLGYLVEPVTFGADFAAKQGMNITRRSGGQTAAELSGGAGTVEPRATAQPAPGGTGTAVPGTQPGSTGTGPTAPESPAVEPGTTAGVGAQAPGSSSGASETATSGSGAGAAAGKSAAGSGGATAPGTNPSTGAPTDDSPAPPPAKPAGRPALQDGKVIITPQNFVAWMTELYATPAAYAGKRVSLEGFIFYVDGAAPEEFAVTRLVVTCHVAHAYPDGLLAAVPGKPRPKQDEWYKVEGVLELTTFQGNQTLKIRVDKMTPIAAPADPYVYP